MKKKKLKLNLKKDVISNLQAKSIVGGGYDDRTVGEGPCVTVDRGNCTASWEYECNNSQGEQDQSNATVCVLC
ncbi:MAG: hypothetical protein ABJK28_08680 [Algibacter sp.]